MARQSSLQSGIERWLTPPQAARRLGIKSPKTFKKHYAWRFKKYDLPDGPRFDLYEIDDFVNSHFEDLEVALALAKVRRV